MGSLPSSLSLYTKILSNSNTLVSNSLTDTSLYLSSMTYPELVMSNLWPRGFPRGWSTFWICARSLDYSRCASPILGLIIILKKRSTNIYNTQHFFYTQILIFTVYLNLCSQARSTPQSPPYFYLAAGLSLFQCWYWSGAGSATQYLHHKWFLLEKGLCIFFGWTFPSLLRVLVGYLIGSNLFFPQSSSNSPFFIFMENYFVTNFQYESCSTNRQRQIFLFLVLFFRSIKCSLFPYFSLPSHGKRNFPHMRSSPSSSTLSL